MKAKLWLILAFAILALVTLASTAQRWLPRLLGFVGANTDLIQGLTDLTQLVLWIGAAVVFLVGLWQRRKSKGTAMLIQDGNADVIVVTDPDQLWRALGNRAPAYDLRQATQRYLEHLVDRYRYLDFKGMGLSDRVPLRLPLVEMYVPLRARIELPEGETWARRLHLAGRPVSEEEAEVIGQRLSEPVPVLDLLREYDGLIMLGDPGAGKTTLLKYLALCLATGKGEVLNVGVRLPILIPLSAYANALSKEDVPLIGFIAAYYRERGIDLPIERMLEEVLAQGGALFLLDGLDEVRNPSQRHLVVERVVDCFAFHRKQGNKFVLTSRVVGYGEVRPVSEGLFECTLVDFGDADIEMFVEKWTAALERAARGDTQVAGLEAERERYELLEAIQRNPGVRGLAANPLLLTILALMKRQGVTLPERRVQLYDQYVQTLLSSWNRARGLGRPPIRDLDVIETMRILAPLALWMHQASPGVGLIRQGDLQRKLEEIYDERGETDPERAARRFLQDVGEYAGLLVERGMGQYGFIHLTFEEYLAAVGIARLGQRGIEPVVGILAEHVDESAWREVAVLTIGHLGIVQQWEGLASDVVSKLLVQQPGEPGQATAIVGEAVADAWPGGVTLSCKERVLQSLFNVITRDRGESPTVRAVAGDAMARLGDPRFRADIWFLPDEPLLGFLEVPLGLFLMGTTEQELKSLLEQHDRERELYEKELPQHELSLPTFYIARYPVTSAQFGAFLEDSGYQTGREWRRRAGLKNHPARYVTWGAAIAYCQWLTDRLRKWDGTPEPLASFLREQAWQVTLPSEAQWEKAARGTKGLRYPWGDEWHPDRTNCRTSEIRTTSAVGCFPNGASPYGALDMSGNLWEWCSSLYTDYPYRPNDGREDAEIEGLRVLRGGSFGAAASMVRCAFRLPNRADSKGTQSGFRVCLVPR